MRITYEDIERKIPAAFLPGLRAALEERSGEAYLRAYARELQELRIRKEAKEEQL